MMRALALLAGLFSAMLSATAAGPVPADGGIYYSGALPPPPVTWVCGSCGRDLRSLSNPDRALVQLSQAQQSAELRFAQGVCHRVFGPKAALVVPFIPHALPPGTADDPNMNPGVTDASVWIWCQLGRMQEYVVVDRPAWWR